MAYKSIFTNFSQSDINILGEYLPFDDINFLNGIVINGVNIITDINKIELQDAHWSVFSPNSDCKLVLLYEFNSSDSTFFVVDIIICGSRKNYDNPKLVNYNNLMSIFEFCNIRLYTTQKD